MGKITEKPGDDLTLGTPKPPGNASLIPRALPVPSPFILGQADLPTHARPPWAAPSPPVFKATPTLQVSAQASHPLPRLLAVPSGSFWNTLGSSCLVLCAHYSLAATWGPSFFRSDLQKGLCRPCPR